MSFKRVYRSLLLSIERWPDCIEKLKFYCFEMLAIYKKRKIYKTVEWSKEEQSQFDSFWVGVYGKRVSNKWHRLYQSLSNSFAVDYIPEILYSTKIEPFYNERKYATVLQDKSILETLCQNCGCVVPTTIFVCSNGYLFNKDRNPITNEQAIELIKKSPSYVIKPTVGSSSGKGIILEKNNTVTDLSYFKSLLSKQGNDYIVQQVIKQHSDLKIFNSSSINTIRVITYITETGYQHFPVAFRIGRSGSHVDNIHAGGLVVGVEDDGSLLSVAYELGYGDNDSKYYKHPDSEIAFEGRKLPKIPEIISAAYKVHGRLPHIGIVSWDFTVDENENPMLIEANIIGQSIWFPQIVHGKGSFGEYTRDLLRKIRG